MERLQQSTRAGLVRPVRKVGLAVAAHWPWPVRVRIENGRRMFVDLRSSIGRGLFMTGQFDPVVFDPLRRALHSGGVFLDIGANVGYYTMLALDLVGDSGAVHAFEMDPRPLRCLRKTAAREGLQNVFINDVAVGAKDGVARFRAESESGHSNVETSGEGVSVRMISLDSWRAAKGVRNIQGIKLDIEGGELWALQGAEKLLREERPLLVCEVCEDLAERSGYRRQQLLEFLERREYMVEPLLGTCSPTVVARPT
jgi:FkbM family methyltransferase